MKKTATLALVLMTVSLTAYGIEPRDTTQVEDFTLTKQSITLNIGESYQLYVSPANANVRWFSSQSFVDNPVALVDENGLVTAVRAGQAYAAAESKDGSIRRQCQITVTQNGSIKTGNKKFSPVNESVWQDVDFTLTNDGKFTAQGTFVGSGARENCLNYVVTDQCIYLSFEIDYEDSTKLFYSQPFSIEIEGCNASQYNIYFNNSAQVVESQKGFVRYSIARGSSVNTTGTKRIEAKEKDGLIYNLKGQILDSKSQKGFYIHNGRKYLVR